MKKIIRSLIILILLAVLLIGIAFTLLVTLVDQKVIKTRVSQMVYSKTGRQLQINGQINWSFFPWLGVKVNNVVLANTAAFKNVDFAKIGEVDVQINPLALFLGKVEVNKFLLKDFNLNLVKNSYGAVDWQDLMIVAVPAQQSKQTYRPTDQTKVSNIEIIDGHIIWQNVQSNQLVEIKNFNFVTQAVGLKEPFVATSNFIIKDAKTGIAGQLDLQGKVKLDAMHKLYMLQNLHLNGQLLGGIIVNSLDVAGTADVSVNLAEQNLDISNLNLQLAKINIVGSAKGINIIDAPKFAGMLSLNNSDLTSIFASLGISAKSTVWKNTALSVNFETTSKFLKLPQITATIGDMQFRGNASYSHFNDKLVSFDLAANKIDFDNLVLDPVVLSTAITNSNSTAIPAAPQVVTHATSTENTNGFLEAVRAIKLFADISVGELHFGKLLLRDFSIELDGDHGKLKSDAIKARLYGGKAFGAMVLDLRQNLPALKLQLKLSGISLQQISAALNGSQKIDGDLNLDGTYFAMGDSKLALLRSLTGSGKLIITNGVYHGLDLGYKIKRASAAILHKSMPKEPEPLQTNLGKLTATYRIEDGLIGTNDLLIQAPDFNATGQGMINLAMQTLTFKLNAQAVHDEKLFLPVVITNTLSDPKVEINVAALIGNTIVNAIAGQLEKETNGKELKQNFLQSLPLDKLFK